MQPAMTSSKIEFANALRGLAAILVLVSHYLGVFWTNRDGAARYTLLPPLPERFVTPPPVEWLHIHAWVNWGALGVGLFFLISGFVIPFSLVNRSRLSFAVARVWRLFPTYAAGFTITLIALYLSTRAAGIEWPYSHYEMAVHYVPGLRDHFRTPNIDGIIWTLEVEVKFYIIIAILSPWLTKRPIVILFVSAALAFFQKSYFMNASLVDEWVPILSWFLQPFALSAHFLILMFVGVTLNLRFTGRLTSVAAATVLALQYLIFAWMWPDHSSTPSVGAFLSYSASIPIFLLSMLLHQHFRHNPMTNFFAEISYPLYVVHAVMGYVLMNALLMAGFGATTVIIAATLTSLAIATLLHHMVERPTQQIGRSLSQRLQPPTYQSGPA